MPVIWNISKIGKATEIIEKESVEGVKERLEKFLQFEHISKKDMFDPEWGQEILDRYKGGRLLLSCAEGYQHLDQFCRRWREGLRSLGTGSYQGKRGSRPAAFPELTPYWCRHSWATQAHRCGVPLDIIARALGHSWSVVTDIYVLYDDAKADEANRLVIDSLK